MGVITFKEGLEDLVRQTIEAEKHLPEGMSVSKNVFEYEDVLGYQVIIAVGKDILENDEDDFSDEDWDEILNDEEGLFGDYYNDYNDYDEDYDDEL